MGAINEITFLTSGSDFHAFHWYNSVKSKIKSSVILDSINPNGNPNYFLNENYDLLLNIDFLLVKKNSRFSNLQRNIVKLFLVPVQSFLLLKKHKKLNNIFWCHGMYFGILCRLCNYDYIVTPQGSEVLIRSKKKIYKYLLKYSLEGALLITVDSAAMRNKLKSLNLSCIIIQNGIEVEKIISANSVKIPFSFLSMRGITSLYRIDEIIKAFKKNSIESNLSISYPFFNDEYLQKIKNEDGVNILGKLSNSDYLEILSKTEYVISIPKSDSSPKSVYEAIFFGCKVITVKSSTWLKECTSDMLERVITIDLESPNWLLNAIKKGNKVKSEYNPSEESIKLFSRGENINNLIEKIKSYDLQ